MTHSPERPHPRNPNPSEVPYGRVLHRSTGVLRVLLAGAAGYFVVAFFVLAWNRLFYPFQLEWMEGGSVEHVRQILAGRSLYAEPTLDFVPFIYTPLYFYVGAAVSWITGLELAPLRMISLVSTLGCFGLIGLWVRRETEQLLPAVLATGLFAATWWISGVWFDLARVDSLFLLLTLAAAWVLRFQGASPTAQVAAGLLIVAAYQTKQSALMVFLPLILLELVVRRAWVTPATVAVAGTLSVGLLQWTSGGWYGFYTITLPSAHAILPGMFRVFWLEDLLAPLPVAMLLAAGWLVRGRVPGGTPARWFYFALTAGMFAAALSSRMHQGGYVNTVIPALAILAILTGLAVGGLRDWSHRQPDAYKAAMARGFLYLACLLQLGRLYYSPGVVLPTTEDRAAGDELTELISSYEGDVLIPYHGYLAARAGKPAFAQAMASFDLWRSGTPEADRWLEEMDEAVLQHRFDVVILDAHPGMVSFRDALLETHDLVMTLYTDRDEVFWPVSGMRTRPWQVYEPRRREGGPSSGPPRP